MSPLTAFAEGTARIWLQKRLVLWLYLINVAFAAVLVFPFRRLVSKISKTDLADDFVAGFQFGTFFDFWTKYSSQVKSLGYSALGLGAVYLIVSIFLTGGMVAALSLERRVSLRRFFNDAGRYFWRYLRLLVLMAAALGLIGFAYHTWGSDLVEDMQERATTDRASFAWRALSVVVLLVVGSLILMVFDYAKIRTVVDRRRSMFVATVVAVGFSLRRAFWTVPLFYFNLLLVGVLLVTYLLVENGLSNATMSSTIGLLVVQQMFILSRIWMKLSFFASQMAYYRSTRRAIADA